MTKIRTPYRTVKVLKIMLDNQDKGVYNNAVSQHLAIQTTCVYQTMQKMLEDGLIYLDREVQLNPGRARKYYKISEDKLPLAQQLVNQELEFWADDNEDSD